MDRTGSNFALHLFYNSVYYRQSQPGPFGFVFGCKKRIKKNLEVPGRDAAAIVPYLNFDLVVFIQGGIYADIFGCLCATTFQLFFKQGIAGIRQKIEYDLLKARWIANCEPYFLLQIDNYIYITVLKLCFYHCKGTQYTLVDVDPLKHDLSLVV